jgi:hypothetical protein
MADDSELFSHRIASSKEYPMLPAAKRADTTTPAKKPYAAPTLTTHGDVAKLTRKWKRPRSHNDRCASDIE